MLCTGSGANAWLEMRHTGLQKLEGMGRDVSAKLGWDASLQRLASLRVHKMEASGDAGLDPSEYANERHQKEEFSSLSPEG